MLNFKDWTLQVGNKPLVLFFFQQFNMQCNATILIRNGEVEGKSKSHLHRLFAALLLRIVLLHPTSNLNWRMGFITDWDFYVFSHCMIVNVKSLQLSVHIVQLNVGRLVECERTLTWILRSLFEWNIQTYSDAVFSKVIISELLPIYPSMTCWVSVGVQCRLRRISGSISVKDKIFDNTCQACQGPIA